jgi:ABC-type glycerol-3-phosphate transport system substrate-binding protein
MIEQPVNDYVDLSDPIWDKDFCNLYTINGKTYTISTTSSLFGGSSYIMWYNKTLFNKAGVTNPGELYKAGNWNWDTCTALMKAYKNSPTAVKGTNALFMDGRYMQQSIGAGVFKYDSKSLTFSSNLDNPLVSKALTKMAEWGKDGYIGGNNLLSGKAAMQLSFIITKKDVQNSKVTINDLGFVPAPDFDSSNPRVKSIGGKGWGIAKGAKNPVGAGIFIKYYSDPGNYNTDDFFVSSEFTDLFFKLKTENIKTYHETLYGVCAANGVNSSEYWNLATGVEPNQIGNKLQTITSQTEARAAEATKVLRNAVK